ncbi:hypothetical protein MUN77_01955 [Leucobacter allii]|uniref:SdrD B-like domain-containing protein n=1 Tax=Leucobacter allii TaxID=2932247 RepID=UPI001FD16068|nr:SdrD B-like domain-containing protein [Leucobacter allii]UOR02119.1 hypothetical protein MUN77_01955 [Leucobacter allii]
MHRTQRRRARRRFTAIASGLAALTLTAGVVTPALAAPGDGVLTVEVNRDFSGDGVYEAALDPGQSGIEVTVTDGTTTLGPLATDANGHADFDLGTLAGSRFRVDVTIPDTAPDYLEFAPAATTATADAFRSATSFVDGATQTIHVGVWNPSTYVTRNPKVAVAQQVSRGTADTRRSLMVTDWDNRGPFDMTNADNAAGIAQVASQAETGTVFGTAWDYRRNGLFSAAYAKSYTVYGPGGPGGIYRTDTAAGGTSGNTVLWATVPNAGTSVHQTIAGRDDAFFLAAGSEGLGGLAMSEDGATLYAVNLAEKSLYTFDAAAAAPAAPTGSTAIADPGCVGGDWRPFAVTVRDGEVYVGGICDASVSLARADLAVHILRLDGGAFAPVYSHALDFGRGSQAYADPPGNLTDPEVSTHWNPWRDTWDADIALAFTNTGNSRVPIYPMPLLTSFAFENDGSLVLDFRDRKTDSYPANGTGPDGVTPTAGHVAGGDLNKVCLTGGVYEWEGEGACPNNATQENSAQSPFDRVEFFPGEFMTGEPRYGANVTHTENSLGAVLLSPREPDVLATTMNPTQLYNSSGFGFYDRQDGSGPGNDWENRALLIAGNASAGNFAKGSGLGGVSLLAAPAPIQIGNYVWFDQDRDGEQGADEIAVPGATVRLLDADGNVLAETTTDENGEYYFGGEGGYALVPGAEYIVEFDLTTVDPTQLPGSPSLDELSFTVTQDPDAGEIHDSNPTPTDNPLIGRAPVTAPDHPGGVDHTIDAGIFFGRPGIDIVKFDGRAEAPENPVDGPDAVDGEYGDPTPGAWDPAVDADTEDTAVEYPVSGGSTGPQPVDMIITNTGNLALTDVSVADLTVEGAEIADLSCDFSPLGGPATGTSWDGPFAPGDSFRCSGTLTMGYDELHHDIASVTGQPVDEEGEPVGEEIGDEDPYWATTPVAPVPGIDIVKFDGRAETPENPVDGPDAVDGEYGDPTPGDWDPAVDADTEDDAVEYPLDGDSTGPQPVDMIITNTGELALTDVTVADLTVEGAEIADLSCDFSPLGGPATGVTWEGPFEPGASFRCSGTLTMGPEELHHDIASVTGQPVDEEGEPFGEEIGDEDPYWAVTPALPPVPGIDIVKFDGRTSAPENPVDGPDAVDGEYGGPTPGDWAPEIDADTEDQAVEYPLSGDSTGPQPVDMIITNTGELALADVTVSDLTVQGSALADVTCDFSPLGGPATGTSWAGPFQPGDSFTCTGTLTMGAAELHHDIASVTGQPVDETGEPVGERIGDEDPYWALTPEKPVTPGTEKPGVDITKRQAKTGDEADTTQTAITAKAGERVIVEMPVKNSGDVPLTRVAVTDRTDDGPAMAEFRCTFPDGTKVDAVDGEVRWAATFADPATAQWDPGVTFICTGVVTLAAGQAHADTVTVHAVAPDGTKLTDDNPFHVRTPDAPGLSVTGGTISVVLIAFAVALVALGIVLILIRRRSHRASDTES